MRNYLYLFLLLFVSLNTKSQSSENDKNPPQPSIAVHNLIWVMDKKAEIQAQQFISPDESLLTCAVEWAKSNPQLDVHVVYDGSLLEQQHVANSQDFISKAIGADKLRLVDVRTLPLVIENPTAFSTNIPIALRVDLLRVVKSYHDLKKSGYELSSYVDIDAKPFALMPVCEARVEDLNNYGLLMAKEEGIHRKTRHSLLWENGFHVFSRENEFLKALDLVLIQPCINRFRWHSCLLGTDQAFKELSAYKQLAKWFPKEISKITADDLFRGDSRTDFVYTRIENVVAAYHSLKGRVDCLGVVAGKMLLLDYLYDRVLDANSNQLIQLGNEKISLACVLLNPYCELSIDSNSIKGNIAILDKTQDQRIYVPTVKVDMPESRILGNHKRDEAREERVKASFLPDSLKNNKNAVSKKRTDKKGKKKK